MKINAKHLILDLLLAFNQALCAKDAIAACRLFGVNENSVRVALARLSAEGLIEAEERANYRLSASALTLAGDVATWRTAEQRIKSWDGTYLAVFSASLGRTNRTALRKRERALQLLGFKELQQGLHVRPNNIEHDINSVRKRLYNLGLESEAIIFIAHEFNAHTEQQIHALWDTDALNQNYQQLHQQMATWLLRAQSLEPQIAARESFVLGSKAIKQVVFDPLLPEPLVDVKARHAFVEMTRHFDQVGHQIWRDVIGN
ncbi:MAG: GntR family transcriptional regulator [Moraxellaceae bacterium]|nr:GntR family transcriptional regulator [Moraxellaceae bacterium]